MIKVLDSLIADKIAAGEVIERPVSIVKELVENSIDAGAKTIYVEIKNGGKTYIRVTDNGCGMSEEDLPKSILRHATSKISTVDDLNKISTLGFRGEALASIAAVSRLTIVSRTEDKEAGLKSVFHGGQEISSEFVGANVGTTIIVEDLFYNTPARKKFMSSNARESSAIIDLLESYAIYYADIKFALVSNNSTIFTTDGDSNILNALTTIYPTNDYKNLIHVESGNVKGYVSNPGVTKTSKRGQLFFVNGRLVDSKTIDKGVVKGYGDRIFSGYPIVLLFIDVPPETIDVNIHPSKKEVKFFDDNEIINDISSAINAAMHQSESVPEFLEKPQDLGEKTVFSYNPVSSTHGETPSEVSEDEQKKPSDRASALKEFLNNLSRKDDFDEEKVALDKSNDSNNEELSIEEETEKEFKIDVNYEEEIEPAIDINALIDAAENDNDIENNNTIENSSTANPFNFDDLQYKGYVFNSYIIMQSEDSIYLFDQHAAHERIFYEKFKKSYENSNQLPQPILTPITLTVSDSVYALDIDWIDDMYDMGFDVNDFGPNTFVIKGIPAYLSVEEAESFAKDFIDNIGEYTENKAVLDKLIMNACKSAVKANDTLSIMEIKDLIKALSMCDNPFSCPHGRPTFLKVTKDQIEKSFKRK